MAFTYDLSTNVGKLRLLIYDTTSGTALFSDEELSAFLSMTSNDLFAAAAHAARSIMASKALLAKSIRAGNYSESVSDIAKFYKELAQMFEEKSLTIPADAQAEVIYTDFNYNQLLQDKANRNEPLDE